MNTEQREIARDIVTRYEECTLTEISFYCDKTSYFDIENSLQHFCGPVFKKLLYRHNHMILELRDNTIQIFFPTVHQNLEAGCGRLHTLINIYLEERKKEEEKREKGHS